MAYKFKKIRHNWNYKNNVVSERGNRTVIRQSKGRNRPSPRGSGVPIGSKFKWGFKGKQTYRRVGNRFLVTIKGTKTLFKHKLGRKYGK